MIRRLTVTTAILFILANAPRTDTFRYSAVARQQLPDSTRHGALPQADSLHALERLASDVTTLLDLPEMKTGKVGVEVRSLTTGKILYRANSDKPLTPASNTKVVTTFTALSELGPNYNVRTIVASDATPFGGLVHGNLYVKGYGDPFLSINEIDALIDGVVNSGIKQIDGNIVGDGTFFDNKTERTEYSGDADPVENLPPIEALTIDRGGFTVVISSPRTPDSPCNVQTFPHSYAFQIDNSAVSAAARAAAPRRGKRHAALPEPLPGTRPADNQHQLYGDQWPTDEGSELNQRHPAKKAPVVISKKPAATTKAVVTKKTVTKTEVKPKKTAPKAAVAAPREEQRAASPGRGPLKIALSAGENGRQVITVTGSLPPNRTVSYHYRMKNPPLVIAGMVYDRLKSHGIQISGGILAGQTPARSRVIAEAGRPLLEILHFVMKNSNNFLA
ncbi:MAG: D-alanyl-D-alanine carboxypeptidase, partial [Bacteroidota bacterium]